jgi:hypothetical protein
MIQGTDSCNHYVLSLVFSSFFENTLLELRSIKSIFLTTPVLSVGAPIPFKVGDRPPHSGRTALIVVGHPLIVGDHSPSFWADTPSHRRRPLPLLEGDHFSHLGYWTGHEDYYDHTAQELYPPVISPGTVGAECTELAGAKKYQLGWVGLVMNFKSEPGSGSSSKLFAIFELSLAWLELGRKWEIQAEIKKIPHTGDKASLDRCG